MLIPWSCSSWIVLSPSQEVPGQAVEPQDYHCVPGFKHPAELRPRRSAHILARGHIGEDPVAPEAVVVEDPALGGQPTLSLRLGNPDVAEDRGIDWNTSVG